MSFVLETYRNECPSESTNCGGNKGGFCTLNGGVLWDLYRGESETWGTMRMILEMKLEIHTM